MIDFLNAVNEPLTYLGFKTIFVNGSFYLCDFAKITGNQPAQSTVKVMFKQAEYSGSCYFRQVEGRWTVSEGNVTPELETRLSEQIATFKF